VTTVLIIDDSEAARAALRSTLAEAGSVERVIEAADGLAGLRMLLAEPVDAVICDLEMPGLDGEKLLAARGCRPGAEDVPFLVVTARRDPDAMARLLRAGASDTLTKPFHPAELVARLETQLRVRRLQTELRDKNAMLARLSSVDPVTGLRTRRLVEELLAIEVLRATRYRTSLAVLMLDIDHFKSVNDAHGHRTGDAVLAAVGAAMRATLRAIDVAGRYGGEEFLTVLPQTGLEGACVLGERLRVAIAASEVEVTAGRRVRVTASFGVAALGDGIADAGGLIEAADAALYRAKAAGRDRVVAAPVARRGGLDRKSRNPTPPRRESA
jgi:diguanylate cyclase (GGDEF)-like protein